jgi:hypothetical protein
MKTTLTFNMPDEAFECEAANKGTQLALAFQEIDARLRSMAKYDDKNEISIESMRSMLRDETQECGFLWY